MKQPNVLFIMCDQFRYDCIAALGNQEVLTPNLDRLVKRGFSMENAYSTCPVCIPARYTIRTGCEPMTTCFFSNAQCEVPSELELDMQRRCGKYLAAAMNQRGYYTFGIGKFHTVPAFEQTGFTVQKNTEELWSTPEEREKDVYATYIKKQHPEYDHIEQLHGERTEMYYMPQLSAFPQKLTVEGYVTDLTLEQLDAAQKQTKPYFGFVSFIGPHPPCAPPVPFNRIYNPDKLSSPIGASLEIDHADEQITFMNHLIWANEINDFGARAVRSRYYAEITYIDACIGRILDWVETSDNAENTLICFFSDHGDHLGDHHAWQKESYFEQSAHIPFLISWPTKLGAGQHSNQLVCLTDLFGIATKAAGAMELREGVDVLGAFSNRTNERKALFAVYGTPGTPQFKFMVRTQQWKYIWMANGARAQMFNLHNDSMEQHNLIEKEWETAQRLHAWAYSQTGVPSLHAAIADGDFKAFSYTKRPQMRICQMASDLGVQSFGL